MPTNRPTSISPYSNRGQGMILVLLALKELTGSNSKQAVIDHITRLSYYEVTRHDLPPYLGQSEPKYHTLLAWARKDCVDRNLILNDEVNAWALTPREGHETTARISKRFASGELDVRKCYLWTPKFKMLMNPSYTPSDADAERPEDIQEALIKFITSL
jgi:hypothetical protein